MDGDEDMGEEITMRGQQYKFLEKESSNVQLGGEPGEPKEDGEKVKPTEEEKKASGSRKYQWWMRGDPAEKVSFVDPVVARQHTTFYAEQAGAPAAGAPAAAPEQVHVLNPTEAQAESNGPNAFPNAPRTAFYDKVAGLWREVPIQSMAQFVEDVGHGIHNKNVRPDVYLTVFKAIPGSSRSRKKYAPKPNPAYKSDGVTELDVDENGFIKQGALPETLAQTEWDHKHVDPITRTNRDPWVYQFSKDHITQHN